MGEAKRIAEGPMTDSLKAACIGIRVSVSSRAITSILESFSTGLGVPDFVAAGWSVALDDAAVVCARAPSGSRDVRPALANAKNRAERLY